jgi:hypothetical protein
MLGRGVMAQIKVHTSAAMSSLASSVVCIFIFVGCWPGGRAFVERTDSGWYGKRRTLAGPSFLVMPGFVHRIAVSSPIL